MVRKGVFTLAILQARMSSSRLPGKVMMTINGEPMIYRQIQRILQASTIDKLVVATSNHTSDDSLYEFLAEKGIDVFRGSLNDVLSRFIEIEQIVKPTAIIRLTGDCPLVMPNLIDKMVNRFYDLHVDYLSNTLEPTYPDGLDVEIVKVSALGVLLTFNLSEEEKEHVTLGIYSRPLRFSIEGFNHHENLSDCRWTVDYPEDLLFVRRVFNEFKGRESTFTLEDVLFLLERNPQLKSAIPGDRRNEKLGGKDFVE
jgi:spore coat polysaccharide biosynthesis protein SpsF